jgi:hypothetical protein
MKMQYSSKIGPVSDVRFLMTSQTVNQPPSVKTITESEKEAIKVEQAGKMRWGAPTWYLFHTIAEKVREESFPSIRSELLNIILTICTNLPCPDCAGHASKYIKGINFDTIVTKQDLKDMLFRFHNSVNARKNFPLFTQTELNSKYASANTVAIIQNFFQVYDKSNASSKLSVNFLYRSTTMSNIKTWFTLNIGHFMP